MYKISNNSMNTITIVGIGLLFFYSVSNILTFIGIDQTVLLSYILFYGLMMISTLVLPKKYPEL
jgi:hypothetical protein